MKFWQSVAFCEPEQIVEVARIAEEVGFEGILVSDHLFFPGRLESRYPYSPDGKPGFGPDTPFPDPWAAIAAMAAVTTRLRFATMVYILPLRHPLEVAKAASTVAILSGDRFALGAGAGWIREEFQTLGVDFASRGRRFDESIAALRTVWRGGMVEHRGEHFAFGPLQMSPAPRLPVPIWVGGTSPAALRRATRLGDGWIGTGQTPEQAEAILADLERGRRQAGREREPFEAIVPLVVPPEVGLLRHLAERGASGTVSYPFMYTLGPSSTLAQKRAYLEGFAEQVIAKLGNA